MKFNQKVYDTLKAAGFSTAILLSGSFLVAPNEGKVDHSYLDPVNIVTSCYGHTGPDIKMGQRFTDEECYKQLGADLTKAQYFVHLYVKVPLTSYQEAALISFTYNAGQGKLKSSTMLKKFNSKDYAGGCQELVKWIYAGGRKLNGLVVRRNEELAMCLGDKEVINFVEEEKLK